MAMGTGCLCKKGVQSGQGGGSWNGKIFKNIDTKIFETDYKKIKKKSFSEESEKNAQFLHSVLEMPDWIVQYKSLSRRAIQAGTQERYQICKIFTSIPGVHIGRAECVRSPDCVANVSGHY